MKQGSPTRMATPSSQLHTHQHMPPHARSTRAPAETSWNCLSGSVLPRSLDLTAVSSVDLFPLAVQGKVGPAGNHSAGSRGNRGLENRDVSAAGSCQRNGHTSDCAFTSTEQKAQPATVSGAPRARPRARDSIRTPTTSLPRGSTPGLGFMLR